MSVWDDVSELLGAKVISAVPQGGGSINGAARYGLADGRSVFVKTRSDATAAEFRAEAAGLEWLRGAGAASVPEVIAVGEEPPLFALEWIERGTLSTEGAERLGVALAELHAAGAEAHGCLPPGAPDDRLRVGPLPIKATARGTWAEVYAENRLLPMARSAGEQGSLSAGGLADVERVADRMDELAGPAEPPARLHGDLWLGNVLAEADGEAWLIDPAAHGGHREVDLAMLRLFGAPSERIFAAYEERAPLAEGHAERVELWQLFPLLVHAVLFGGSYGESAARVARRYA